MSDSAAVRGAGRLRALRWPGSPGGAGWRAWLPAWSVPAALRAVRATIVVPTLFALSMEVIGDPQTTLFAVFGGFASLLFASFGGTRRDKAIAHLGLAIVGSIAVIIGTAVSGSTWLAALVTIPVAFAIFFGGVAGPNTASGVTGALLAYVVPVATAAPVSAIPARLEGWWMASAASTLAVLLLSPRSAGDKLRDSASASARALARQLSKALRGEETQADWESALAAKRKLMDVFGSGPQRPTGLTTADQGLANVAELLEWCAVLVGDALSGQHDLSDATPADRELFSAAAEVLEAAADLLSGGHRIPDLDRLEKARADSAAHQARLTGDPDQLRRSAANAAHAQAIAVAARATLAASIVACRLAGPERIAAERRRWLGSAQPENGAPALTTATVFLARHGSIRSIWFRNSLRGAVALAIAVAVADVSGVQHGFWVVLGTLSILRTNAAATGATALRALAGTAIGFAIGAALLLGIGTSATALWVALPIAICVAAYAPGTTPFAVGQAAFTVAVVVVFNLLVPAGWRVGLLRIEDVAIGAAVSLAVGVLFWPRGASFVVADDLADAFRRGGSYLAQSVDWALGLRITPPETAVAAATAATRLDEALRAYLAEQGTKRLSNQDLWRLVMGSTRLRLTAYSVASLHELNGQGKEAEVIAPPNGVTPLDQPAVHRDGNDGHDRLGAEFQQLTSELVVFYDRVASQLAGSSPAELTPVPGPRLAGPDLPIGVACASNTPPQYRPDMLWVGEYLYHLGSQADAIATPAAQIAELRQRSWWR